MYSSIQDIKEAVKKANGLLTLKLGVIVKASSSGLIRATPGNIRSVSYELEQEGMKLFYQDEHPDQHTLARVYNFDSVAAEIIEAVLRPSKANDDIIRCAALLEQVRGILCV